MLTAWLPSHGGIIGVPVAPAPFLAAATAALLTRTFVFTAVNEESIATGGLAGVELGVAAELCGVAEFDEFVEAEVVAAVIGALCVATAVVGLTEFADDRCCGADCNGAGNDDTSLSEVNVTS